MVPTCVSRKIETRKLIMLVHERRFLYDVNDDDYKNRAKAADAWLEIAREMGSVNGKLWATKWKSLRDNYKKYKKATESNSGGAYKKYKNWPWADLLFFLDNIAIAVPIPICSTSQDSDIGHLSRQTTYTESDNSDDQSNPRKIQKSISVRDVQQMLHSPEKLRKMDDIDHLFASYATSLKKMPVRIQSMLKLDMATLFAKYELQVQGQKQVQDNINDTGVTNIIIKTEYDSS